MKVRRQHSSVRRALMKRLYARQGGYCHWCGKQTVRIPSGRKGSLPANSATIEHLTLHSEGGPLNESNCVMACLRCNQRRGNKPIEAWDAILCAEVRA